MTWLLLLPIVWLALSLRRLKSDQRFLLRLYEIQEQHMRTLQQAVTDKTRVESLLADLCKEHDAHITIAPDGQMYASQAGNWEC